MSKNKPIKRGDIILARHGRKRRLFLVLQNDIGNRYSNQTLACSVFKESRNNLPVHVWIGEGYALVEQTCIIRKSNIVKVVGRAENMDKVDKALRKEFGV